MDTFHGLSVLKGMNIVMEKVQTLFIIHVDFQD